jgi:hypothetical protein
MSQDHSEIFSTSKFVIIIILYVEIKRTLFWKDKKTCWKVTINKGIYLEHNSQFYNILYHYIAFARKQVLELKKIIRSKLTLALQPLWLSILGGEMFQKGWLVGQTLSDEPFGLKNSFSNEIVLFNWQLKWSSSQIYLYGQQVEPCEPQQTP